MSLELNVKKQNLFSIRSCLKPLRKISRLLSSFSQNIMRLLTNRYFRNSITFRDVWEFSLFFGTLYNYGNHVSSQHVSSLARPRAQIIFQFHYLWSRYLFIFYLPKLLMGPLIDKPTSLFIITLCSISLIIYLCKRYLQ